ncbi:hypothetical protein M0802_007532 [Mischocyttarus mexicanus]|nr:hypothetical protein M0802_016839 [Mischocyttarus mexicanus]KAI4497285.1 hypothetical protein M0802_007532 [Mischocyttarus mexicanus]
MAFPYHDKLLYRFAFSCGMGYDGGMTVGTVPGLSLQYAEAFIDIAARKRESEKDENRTRRRRRGGGEKVNVHRWNGIEIHIHPIWW